MLKNTTVNSYYKVKSLKNKQDKIIGLLHPDDELR